MRGIVFEAGPAPAPPAPNRADVALFVGFADVRPGEMAPEVCAWLRENGWAEGAHRRPAHEVDALLDVPVPVESWESFRRWYVPEARPVDGSGLTAATYLGAAVRSFFAQGGRRCYVVRVGRPWRYDAPRTDRLPLLEKLVPGIDSGVDPLPADRATWRGMAHLFGLPEVSFVCLPDLPDLVRADAEPPRAVEPRTAEPEGWVECSEEVPSPTGAGDAMLSRVRAPRADADALAEWARAVRTAGRLVARHAREAQLLAALPIPRPDAVATVEGRRVAAADDPLRYLAARGWMGQGLDDGGEGIASAFVQLVYPWVRTPFSAALPEGIEPPDGALAGMLARSALVRGSWRSAAGQGVGDVWDVFPALGRGQTDRPQAYGATTGEGRALVDRVSLLGPSPAGLRLLSDVTTSLDDDYRPASVCRLVAALVRAVRREGEGSTFENNGERTWERLEERIGELLRGMLVQGALRGSTPAEAFSVRCDASTMSRNDLDTGRVVAHVTFAPAAPVERIRVALTLEEGGGASAGPPPSALPGEAA